MSQYTDSRKHYKISHHSGFTLIELSIVLVIIGLVIGGIVIGRTLISSAELRDTIKSIDVYKSAYNTFKVKYNCLPGDCINATDFFGAQNANATTCQTTSSAGSTLTCNGNGNGRVGGTTASDYESFRFWQQLAIAGLINGSYTGISGAGGTHHALIGTNIPATTIQGGGFFFSSLGLVNGQTDTVNINYGNTFLLGREKTNTTPYSGLFNPSDAMAFDEKIDDGKPNRGLVTTRSISANGVTTYAWGNVNACSTAVSNTDYDASYNTSSSVVACSFFIRTGEY